MTEDILYDVAIVGGGLAGLALSIQLKREGHSVLLIEKETYPFHKVCGEYISLESWDFLTSLGVDLEALQVPIIKQLIISSAGGKLLRQPLPLGGFGVSRYLLDHTLVQIAEAAGVVLLQHTRVNDIIFSDDHFTIETNQVQYRSRMACACYGKRSNIDVKWKRPFLSVPKNKLNNYIGVKYHIMTDFPADTIALHHFKNGYCGIVKIEDNRYNLCYLTRADNLQKSKGDIKIMEREILSRNPYLQKVLAQSQSNFSAPLTISQISFDKKSQVENHVFMIGDAAGMITPLCGNGMSMALHASKIAAGFIQQFLSERITRTEMEQLYMVAWNKQFARRLSTGRRIQRLFGSRWLSDLFITAMKPFPALVNYLVKQTHGRPF